MGSTSEEMWVCQDMVLVIQQVTVISVIVMEQEFIASVLKPQAVYGLVCGWLSFKAQVRVGKF